MGKEERRVSSGHLIEITTPESRVLLTQFSPTDADEIFELIDRNREHLSQNDDETSSKYRTKQKVLDSIISPPNPEKLRLAIRNENGVLVGSINLRPESDEPKTAEVGYYLDSEFTGNGYMTEAVRLLTDYAFDTLGYYSLFGNVFETNLPSTSVLQRAGYSESGRSGSMLQFSIQASISKG